MKWPFVSRGKHEMAFNLHIAVRDQLESRIADLKAHIAQQDHNLEKMREMYHALRTSGANAPSSLALEPAAKPSRPADIAIEEMVELRGGGDRLRRVLRRFVNLERQKPDADEERIAERVKKWSDPDEEAA